MATIILSKWITTMHNQAKGLFNKYVTLKNAYESIPRFVTINPFLPKPYSFSYVSTLARIKLTSNLEVLILYGLSIWHNYSGLSITEQDLKEPDFRKCNFYSWIFAELFKLTLEKEFAQVYVLKKAISTGTCNCDYSLMFSWYFEGRY